jgi:hypothetical protein
MEDKIITKEIIPEHKSDIKKALMEIFAYACMNDGDYAEVTFSFEGHTIKSLIQFEVEE